MWKWGDESVFVYRVYFKCLRILVKNDRSPKLLPEEDQTTFHHTNAVFPYKHETNFKRVNVSKYVHLCRKNVGLYVLQAKQKRRNVDEAM